MSRSANSFTTAFWSDHPYCDCDDLARVIGLVGVATMVVAKLEHALDMDPPMGVLAASETR